MADTKKTLKEKLMKIQVEMKAPKNLKNTFGNYNYRNAEGILEALKPYESKYKVTTTISDEVVDVAGRVYVKAIATIRDIESDEEYSVVAFAREAEVKKGMDDAQVTGATSSYARKYALNGLFLLDDSKDPDTDEYQKQTEPDFSKYDKLAPRKALFAIFQDYGLDGKAICDACGITNESTDEDFKEALKYAEGLVKG